MAKTPIKFETAFEIYSATSVLGEGGAGRVFAVKDSGGKLYALKCLHPNLVTTERKKRFKNEIDFCRKQRCRNLIQVIDVGLTVLVGTNTPFYVMPIFPKTLRAVMDSKVPPERVLPLFAQILDGVETAHLLGVFHRDLKPENFLYDPAQDLVVVADFGIAHFAEDLIVTAVATKATDKLANLRYSAPEQRVKGERVDQRSDIYALGLILNEMFTGSVPQGTGYPMIAAVSPTHGYLDGMIERMIQQNPKDRPATIDEIKKELIGRQNEFVARQKLDSLKREVVPTSASNHVAPVELINIDWQNGTLILKLNRTPESGWVHRFYTPRETYTSVQGAEPGSFEFRGDTANVRIIEHKAQQVVNFFKGYLEMATRAYQADVDHEAARKVEDERSQLRQAIAAAEARERILRSVKF